MGKCYLGKWQTKLSCKELGCMANKSFLNCNWELEPVTQNKWMQLISDKCK